MSLTARERGGGLPPVPEGSYVAVCVGVYDLGRQRNETYKKEQDKVIIAWEITELLVEGGEHEGQPRQISKTYTNSLDVKATLRQELEAWRGRAFNQEELDGFHLGKLLGAPCMLQIIHQAKKDGSGPYAAVKGVMHLHKSITPPSPVGKPLYFDFDEQDQPDWQEKLGQLPEWVQKRVKEAVNYPFREAEAVPWPEGPDPLAPDAAL